MFGIRVALVVVVVFLLFSRMVLLEKRPILTGDHIRQIGVRVTDHMPTIPLFSQPSRDAGMVQCRLYAGVVNVQHHVRHETATRTVSERLHLQHRFLFDRGAH